MNIPEIGLGTFRLKDPVVQDVVRAALEIGYRHIDTAQMYDNEAAIGAELQASAVPREQIFVTTKVWHANLATSKLIPSLQESLQKLQMSSVDLALIHWPSPQGEVPLRDSLEALAKAKAQGLTKNIGVSNFNIALLKEALAVVGKGEILTNQIEVHPFLQNRKVREFCAEAGIRVTAYMPLATGKVASDETLIRMGRKHGVSPSQVTLSWLLDQGLVVIPSSSNPERLQQNFQIPRGILDSEDHQILAALDRGDRIANPPFSPAWD